MTNQQGATAALRLAEELEHDPGINRPSVVAELRRLHAENTALQQGYDAARMEIESLKSQIANHADELTVAHLDGRMRAAQPAGAQQSGTNPELLKFYGATTDAELIAAQAAHIEKLQAKLTKTPSFAPQRVREG